MPWPDRPKATGLQAGLLGGEHLQVAYATNDIARAKELFRARYGIANFAQLGGPLPEGGEISVELAWAGGVMVELVTASGPGSEVYVAGLPVSGFGLRHHHLGYLIRDLEEWSVLRSAIDRGGWNLRVDQTIPGFMRQIFIDAPELGHLLEYLCPEPAGMAFLFDTVPQN